MSTAPSIPNTMTAGTRARAADVNENFTQVYNFVTDEEHSLAVSGIKTNRIFAGHTSTDLIVGVGDSENLIVSSHEIASGTAYTVTTTGKFICVGTLSVYGTLNLNGTGIVI